MAKTKEENTVEEKTTVEENKEIIAPPEPGSRMVEIRIPKTKDNARDVFVSVNQRTFQIQRGVTVKVPDYVAQFLEMRDDQIEKNINALPENR